jgi:hypothetical protein
MISKPVFYGFMFKNCLSKELLTLTDIGVFVFQSCFLTGAVNFKILDCLEIVLSEIKSIKI